MPTPWLCHGCSTLKAASPSWRTTDPIAQFGGAAQHAVDEEAVHHYAQLVRRGGMPGDELVRYGAGKTPIAAVVVEAQQMVAISVGLVDPQFADHAAVGKWLVVIHFGLRRLLVGP